MIDSIDKEFEDYVKDELGDIAVVSEGKYTSPKIQNYYKLWCSMKGRILELAEWKDAVLDELADTHIDDQTLITPRQVLQKVIQWNVDVAINDTDIKADVCEDVPQSKSVLVHNSHLLAVMSVILIAPHFPWFIGLGLGLVAWYKASKADKKYKV